MIQSSHNIQPQNGIFCIEKENYLNKENLAIQSQYSKEPKSYNYPGSNCLGAVVIYTCLFRVCNSFSVCNQRFFCCFSEQRRLQEDEYPLLVRVMLGPHEDVAKLYLMDKHSTDEISCEVAQFLNLSIAECKAILERYTYEEERETRRIKAK